MIQIPLFSNDPIKKLSILINTDLLSSVIILLLSTEHLSCPYSNIYRLRSPFYIAFALPLKLFFRNRNPSFKIPKVNSYHLLSMVAITNS